MNSHKLVIFHIPMMVSMWDFGEAEGGSVKGQGPEVIVQSEAG